MHVFTSQSSQPVITPQFMQSNTHPRVTLNNTLLPLERTPHILGVTFDPHFKFWAHLKSILTRTSPRINIIKAPANTNWGGQKETMLITYISLMRSLFIYVTPIWFPNDSPSLIQILQTIQNLPSA